MHRMTQGAQPEAPACAAGNVSIMGLFTVQVSFAEACALASKAMQAIACRDPPSRCCCFRTLCWPYTT